eukprot:5846363-Amphidinium_carterae.1
MHVVVLSTTPNGILHSVPHLLRVVPADEGESVGVSPNLAREWYHLKSLLDPGPLSSCDGDPDWSAEVCRHLADRIEENHMDAMHFWSDEQIESDGVCREGDGSWTLLWQLLGLNTTEERLLQAFHLSRSSQDVEETKDRMTDWERGVAIQRKGKPKKPPQDNSASTEDEMIHRALKVVSFNTRSLGNRDEG